MTDAWFAELDADADPGRMAERVLSGSADAPEDWPATAVDAGFAPDEESYYELLHEVTVAAARAEVADRERADDQQLIHAVRAMDDAERVANELAERVVEWGRTLFDDVPGGLAGVEDLAERDAGMPFERRVVSYALRVDELTVEVDDLRSFVERRAPAVAPNLSEMAGPVLAARLIALAGGLDSLAKMPSGTVQVLGAEDALFAHLSGRAPSPKHGIIYTHEMVNGTRREDRGSAARALAGKLSIAARIDHYSGEYKEGVHEQLEERMRTIRARGGA